MDILLIIIKLDASNWIAIVNILATCTIGIWIAVGVEKNLTKSRFLKDYFIQEVKDIRDQYKKFLSDVYCGKKSAIDIKDWLKVMSLKINNLHCFLHKTYSIDDSIMREKHSDIQKYITGTDDYNEKYKLKTITFNESTRNDILKLNAELINVLMQRVVDINNANKSNWFSRKKNK